MNTGLMMGRITEASPRSRLGWLVSSLLVVFGDAAATAHNILTHEMLYRFIRQ